MPRNLNNLMITIKSIWFILAGQSFKFKNIPVEYLHMENLVFIDKNYNMYILISFLIN